MAEQSYDYLLKLVLTGDPEVGKTSVMKRYAEDSFSSDYVLMIGIEFKHKLVSIDDKIAKLQIWDTHGRRQPFQAISSAYYRGAHGVMIVYDVGNQVSLDNIKYRIREAKEHVPSTAQIMILGNKCDIDNESRMVSTDRGKLLADECEVMFMEVSAKTGDGIDNAFTTLTKSILKNLQQSNR